MKKIGPQKRQRETINASIDRNTSQRRRLLVTAPKFSKFQRSPGQTLAVKNSAFKLEQFPARLNLARIFPVYPEFKTQKLPVVENIINTIDQKRLWRILKQAPETPEDERVLCRTLLQGVAELRRAISKTQLELSPAKLDTLGVHRPHSSIKQPKYPTYNQVALIANILNIFKTHFDITAPLTIAQVIEQVCKNKQGILRCKKCKEAGKVRAWCKVCWGSQICCHGRQKRQCKDCGGSGLCMHGRRKSRCKDCGGSGLCKHRRRKGRCKLCGGTQICHHGRRRTHCKICGGNGLCSHGRQKSRCKDCGTLMACKPSRRKLCGHGTWQADCKDCQITMCPVCKTQLKNKKCNKCLATSTCKHGIITALCDKCMGAPHCTHGKPCTCCAVCAANAVTPNGTTWVWGGASVGRVRGTPTICRHGRLKSYCKECGGSPICKHGRDERYCRECGGSGLCRHLRVAAYCKDCHGDAICFHGFKTHRCKKCSILMTMPTRDNTRMPLTPPKLLTSTDAVSALLLLSSAGSPQPATPGKSKGMPSMTPPALSDSLSPATPMRQLQSPLRTRIPSSSMLHGASGPPASSLSHSPPMVGQLGLENNASPWPSQSVQPRSSSVYSMATMDALSSTMMQQLASSAPPTPRHTTTTHPAAQQMPYIRPSVFGPAIGGIPIFGYSSAVPSSYSKMLPAQSSPFASPPPATTPMIAAHPIITNIGLGACALTISPSSMLQAAPSSALTSTAQRRLRGVTTPTGSLRLGHDPTLSPRALEGPRHPLSAVGVTASCSSLLQRFPVGVNINAPSSIFGRSIPL